MDDTTDDDGAGAVLLGVAIFLFLLGTLIYNFGRINWLAVGLVALAVGFVTLCVALAVLGVGLIGYGIANAIKEYRASELYRYRKYRHAMRKAFRKLMRQARRL